MNYLIYLLFATVLFTEDFENTSWSARGWYDSPSGTVVVDNRPGSTGTHAFQCAMILGGQGCTGGSPARHLFTPTNSVYISYWQKYSANYTTDGHEFYILTTADDDFSGLAANILDVYLQKAFVGGNGKLSFELQDVLMIDQANIGTDLKGVTENRSIAGCNGNNSNTGGTYDCYDNGIFYNDWVINTTADLFTTTAGAFYKNDWHHIEAYAQLNTVAGGIGQNDGILRYWFDGVMVLNKTNVMFRTGANPTMQFNQFVIGPFIGGGAAVAQSFWVDDLVVADVAPYSGITHTITWADGVNTDHTGYTIQKKNLTAGTYADLATVGASTFTYTDSASPNAVECYRVRAIRSGEDGPNSTDACIGGYAFRRRNF